MPQVKCPTCKKSGDWFAGKYGPFCSHRCKLVDLGKWFSAEHVISEPLRPNILKSSPTCQTVNIWTNRKSNKILIVAAVL